MYLIIKGFFEPYPEQILERCDTFSQASKRMWELATACDSNFVGRLIGDDYMYTFDTYYLVVKQAKKYFESQVLLKNKVDKKDKIYISGAVSSDADYYNKFENAAKMLAKEFPYHTIVIPTRLSKITEQGSLLYKEYLLIDMFLLSSCSAIYLLDDWEESAGAIAEVFFAQACGLEVMPLLD